MEQQKSQYILLKVHPVVHEYYKCIHGECIDLSRENPLSHRVAYLLEKVKPRNYQAYKIKNFKFLQLRLHRFNLAGTRVEVFGNYTYLDDFRQQQLSKELYQQFKNAYHAHVLGFCRAGGLQSDGIKDFCEIYTIPCDYINFEMLKKSWDRSNEKKALKKVKNKPLNTPVLSPQIIQ